VGNRDGAGAGALVGAIVSVGTEVSVGANEGTNEGWKVGIIVVSMGEELKFRLGFNVDSDKIRDDIAFTSGDDADSTAVRVKPRSAPNTPHLNTRSRAAYIA
jgi:hypothetical protein